MASHGLIVNELARVHGGCHQNIGAFSHTLPQMGGEISNIADHLCAISTAKQALSSFGTGLALISA
jgi:hypothetical protein